MAAGVRPVDIAHLSRYTGGDADINSEVLMLFTGQSEQLLSRLDAALDSRDPKSWHDIAHSLKGGARGIGAFALAEAAQAAEECNPAADPDGAAKKLGAVRALAEAVRLFVDAYLGR
jgi:HPt (histidine-containing phosphotransfer) domain-containing protein